MATGPRHFVPMRRRREGKTNYYQRMNLVVTDKPRMVVRKTNRQIIIQLVKSEVTGDHTLVTAISKELTKFGYQGSLSNLPAAYLTGLLFANRAKKAGYGEAVLDLGLHRASHGARIFGALKGAVAGGLNIPHSTDILPDDSRLRGEHIAAHTRDQTLDIVQQVAKISSMIVEEGER